MAKVVTSQGLPDFVSTGKPTETIEPSKKVALDAKLAETDKPEVKADAPPEEVKGDAEAVPEAELDDEEKKFAKDIQKKIFKQIAKRKEAQAEARTAREEAAEAERFAEQLFNERELWKQKATDAEQRATQAKPAESKEPELTKPNPEDKKFYDAEGKFKVWEYSAELADFSAKKALADDRKAQQDARDKANAEVRAKAEAAAAEEFSKRLEKAKDKHRDWDEVVTSSPIMLQNECLQYIKETDNGTELAYFLAKNPERAEKIRVLRPTQGIAALRDVEIELGLTKVGTAAAVPPKEAEPARSPPAPITPIATNGAGTTQLDPAKMNFKQLRAYERERGKRR
jgi:hypothetical protein